MFLQRPPALRKKNPLREGQDKFKAISDEEEDTTFSGLAMEDVLGLGRLRPRSVGFWVGKFQESNLTKKKGKVSGNLLRLFQKNILVKYIKYSIWPDVMFLYHSRRWCSNIL